jgi:hypothetical protein
MVSTHSLERTHTHTHTHTHMLCSHSPTRTWKQQCSSTHPRPQDPAETVRGKLSTTEINLTPQQALLHTSKEAVGCGQRGRLSESRHAHPFRATVAIVRTGSRSPSPFGWCGFSRFSNRCETAAPMSYCTVRDISIESSSRWTIRGRLRIERASSPL